MFTALVVYTVKVQKIFLDNVQIDVVDLSVEQQI